MTQLQTDAYRTALRAAQDSYAHAAQIVSEAEAEIARRRTELAQLRRTITALAAQCSEEPDIDPMGITEACTAVMQATIHTLSTQEVVGRLSSVGFDITSQKNVAASAHAILSRLASKGKITKIANKDGKVVGWRGLNYDQKQDMGPIVTFEFDAPV